MTLATKYRPTEFEDVLSDSNAVMKLRFMSKDELSQTGWLLTGPAGTGKTTLARIIASKITSPANVTELDAATHTGVDSIRSLIEQASNSALGGGLRVFIIDEAHMLSKSAVSALLKTLEEAEGKYLFILCTTEEQKILWTIRTRLRHIQTAEMSDRQIEAIVAKVAEGEGISVDFRESMQIAQMAQGSGRAAIMIMEQYRDGNKLDLPEMGSTFDLVEHIANGEVLSAVKWIRRWGTASTLSDINSCVVGMFDEETYADDILLVKIVNEINASLDRRVGYTKNELILAVVAAIGG